MDYSKCSISNKDNKTILVFNEKVSIAYPTILDKKPKESMYDLSFMTITYNLS